MESKGTFFIRKSATVKTGWRLMRESYLNGKRLQKSVPKTAWPALGFHDAMTPEEARARAQQLNAQNTVERLAQQKISKIAERVDRDRLHHSAFVPEDLNVAFLKWLEDNVTGSEKHLEKMKIHWHLSKKILITLQLRTESLADNRKQLYRYFATNEYSLDYVCKLIRMMNLFGRFVGRLTGKHFEEVLVPKGHDREMINDAYVDSDSYYGPSEPLTPELLEDLKRNLKEEQWRWLYVSMWFGLRPSEVGAKWRLEEHDNGPDVLWVYQPKLTAKPRLQRWKPIPILYPEQGTALEMLQTQTLHKPLTKTLKRYSGMHLTLYGGRKGFTDLMLDKGQKLEDIAHWLGHSSIEITWQRYRDKRRVHFTK